MSFDATFLGIYHTLQVTQYKGYGQNDRTIKIFWVICHALPKDAKKRLLGEYNISSMESPKHYTLLLYCRKALSFRKFHAIREKFVAS